MSGETHTTASQPWEQCLAALNERDGAVEITGLSAQRDTSADPDQAGAARKRQQNVAPSFRVRLLAWRPAGLVVDRPANPEEAHYFQQGAVVRVLAVDGPARWELMTTVSTRVKFRLNEHSVIPAIVLSRPHEVNSVQRREFFRVSTAAAKVPPVKLTPVYQQPEIRQPGDTSAEVFGPWPDLRPFTGVLVNVGGGGMGIEAPANVAFALSLCTQYRCVLNLPSMDKPLEVDCTLVHLETLKAGEHYLGLRFETATIGARRRLEDQICNFTSSLQRQQIQRSNRAR